MEVRPVLASFHLINDLALLAVRGVQSGDEKCANEINELLSTTPEHLREYVNDAIEWAKVHVASDKRTPDPFKKAVVQLKALSCES